MLEIRSLVKRYGTSTALDHVSVTFKSGQTHILLGSSGSGKSTLLRAILGLINCDEGEVLFEGHSISQMTPQVRALRMGYVPQDGGLFPHLTAFENASIVAKAQGWSKEKIKDRANELVPILSLNESLLSRYPNELSGGQKQRIALLRATFLNPDWLMMDEPLTALDPLVRSDLQAELKDTFSRLEKTVLFVTHDIGEAAYLGNDVVLMHQGKIVQTGRVEDLRDRPAAPFVTRFMNAQRIFAEGEKR